MITIKRFSKKIILLLFSISILYSCSKKTNENIRIGILDGPSAVSFIQMIEQTPLIDGKKVEIIIKSEPLQIQALMMRNELEFAILPTVMAANLYNKGLKYKMIACPIWGTLYLMTNDKEINFNNLSGKKINVFGQATTSDILLRRLLLKNEINGVTIDNTYSTNNEIAQALLYKKIGIAVVSEPMASNLLSQDSSIKIIRKLDCREYIDNFNKDVFVQTAFLVNNSFTEEYPDLVLHICEAYTKSCNFTNDQPDYAAKLLVKHKISPTLEAAKLTLPLCNIRYVGAFALEQEVMQYLNIFYQYNPKSVGGKLPEKDFIYQTY